MQNSSTKSEQINQLINGKGIRNLLNEAYKIFGNPILIHDMEYKIVDMNINIETDDPIWNEYAAKKTVSHQWLEFFKNECFLEAAANAKTITFLTSDKLNYNRVFGKTFNKNNIQIGCAVMIACYKPFDYDDPMLFEKFCAILSKEFGLDDFYTEYGQSYFEKLVDELIAGVNDFALYAAHVESIYMHLKSNLYLAVVDIGRCDPTYTQLAYYRDLFKKIQPEYTYAIHGNYILIIISTDDNALYVEKDLNQLNQSFQQHKIYASVSKCFENLYELNRYFKATLAVLNKCLEMTSQHIFLHDQYSGFA